MAWQVYLRNKEESLPRLLLEMQVVIDPKGKDWKEVRLGLEGEDKDKGLVEVKGVFNLEELIAILNSFQQIGKK